MDRARRALSDAESRGSSAGTGFYVSGSAQVTETRTEQNDNFATWQGSNLSAASMSINADVASIVGSDVTAGALALNADSILLGAGTNTESKRFEQDSRNVGVGISSSEATQHVNWKAPDILDTRYVNADINVGRSRKSR